MQLCLKIDDELLAVIDAELARMKAATPGATLTRSAAVRSLLLRGAASEHVSKVTSGPAALAKRFPIGKRRR
jgi:hypothetical protein